MVDLSLCSPTRPTLDQIMGNWSGNEMVLVVASCVVACVVSLKRNSHMLVLVGLGNGSREILKCMPLSPPTGTLLLPVTKSNSCLCCSVLNPCTTSQKFLNEMQCT